MYGTFSLILVVAHVLIPAIKLDIVVWFQAWAKFHYCFSWTQKYCSLQKGSKVTQNSSFSRVKSKSLIYAGDQDWRRAIQFSMNSCLGSFMKTISWPAFLSTMINNLDHSWTWSESDSDLQGEQFPDWPLWSQPWTTLHYFSQMCQKSRSFYEECKMFCSWKTDQLFGTFIRNLEISTLSQGIDWMIAHSEPSTSRLK